MKNRLILAGTVVSLALLIGCGDDDTDDTDTDAGTDAGDWPEAGTGGTGGRGGNGGRGGGGAGRGGRGGSSGAGGESGAGGQAGGGGDETYSVGGEVSGLTGSGLVLQNNGGDDLTVTEAGDFAFATQIASGEAYAVTVKTQPASPTQNCTVANGSGEVGDANVDNVAVTCTTGKYKVSGTITGLTGTGLVLHNNGGDALNASGSAFEFATSIDSGANYAVTVATQPTDQVCSVTNGSGAVGSADVTSVAVACHGKNILQLEPSFGSAIATWNDTSAASYTLKRTTAADCDFATTSCADFAEITNATSPATVPGLTDGTVYYFQLTANYPGDVKSGSNKIAVRPNKARFNGIVYSIATGANGVKYAGGAFTRASVHSGGAVPVNKTSGFPSDIPNFPLVDADIYAVAADGSGGYYIGGTFNAIGGEARGGLAHIKSDGTLDAAWNPGVDGLVRTIAVRGTTVYIAGDFANAGGQPRAGLAAIGTDGNLVATFNPVVTPAASVGSIAFVGSADIVVGGSFTAIGGGTQANIAQLDGTTGAIKAGWNPTADGRVSALAVNGDIIYAGGEFINIGGAARRGVAALNATGAMAAMATAWDPSPNNAVTQIVVANSTVYISGAFTTVGAGEASVERSGVAAIDPADAGAVKEWNPVIAPTGTVGSLAVSADTVYLAGIFESVGGMTRNGVAAVSSTGAGDLKPWNPNPDNGVAGVVISGESVVAIGQFRGIGGLVRSRLVAFDAAGNITSWNPAADNTVHTVVTSGTKVFVGGEFIAINGTTRNRIAAIADNGTLDATWDPNATSNVYSFAVDGTTLYVGGGFTNIGGQDRFAIAAVSTEGTGMATAWNPGADSNVRALSLQGTTLYAGGEFLNFGTLPRNRLASIVTSGNTASAWNPNVNGRVSTIVTTADTVYAGGEFTMVGTTARNYLAAINVSDGLAGVFAPEPTGFVHALALDNGALYAGGEFLTIQTLPFNHYAGWDATGAFRDQYIFDFDLAVRALAVGADAIYVVGDFEALNGQYTSGFASVAK